MRRRWRRRTRRTRCRWEVEEEEEDQENVSMISALPCCSWAARGESSTSEKPGRGRSSRDTISCAAVLLFTG